jgi:hypothetical protein
MKISTLLFTLISLCFVVNLNAQMGGGGHHINPDSLQFITVSGTAIVDTNSMMHPIYYIDTNNNGEADYFLNFGPPWYEPDSSNATRPNNGDQITIEGGLWDGNMMGNQMIVVYEINGEFWRDPYNPFWNHMGHQGANCGHNMDSCNNSGWGWQHDPPVTVRLSGYAIVDSTFMMEHYYLDEDNDGTPDYFLNFGPPWYEPNSGAHRPANGDQIDIVGGLIENSNHPMVIVYEINGLFWRDSSFFGGHMGGGWIHRYMNQSEEFNTPFDEQDWIKMNPGWYSGGGGGHHGGMHDSLFCQIMETEPGSMFTIGDENAFAGYEIDFYYPGMMGGGMHHGMGCSGHMEFNSNANFQFHYTDDQLNLLNINEQTIQVKFWDTDVESWVTIGNAAINTSLNKITFSNSKVGNFYILTGDSPTETGDPSTEVKQYTLEQNYPNPFNPSTTIKYSVPQNSMVSVKVYNIVGQEIADLVHEMKSAGTYTIEFDAVTLPSGVYFYKIQAGSYTETRKMVLMK